jgi:peptidoglycan/LPS O-acetylase OafA/YrhL
MGEPMATSTVANTAAKKQGAAKKKSVFRPDIQGLRAVAVLLVIADHLFAYPTGGFVGVDIFFVISGFLITGLLIREQNLKGRISFSDFYRRRARRILPLSVMVLVATVAASFLIFTTGRALRIGEDALWSLFFGTNWHFALIGTDYMQNDGVVSPLQHFWSLAVEEQFYVVWPWIVVLVLGVAASKLKLSGPRARLLLVAAMAAVVAASFAFSIWETATSPTFAYFSTFSRAWELGLGALLAAIPPAAMRMPAFVRTILAYIGLAGIAYSAFFFTTATPFPGPWAAVPVVSTVVLIAAGTGNQPPLLAPLTNPVSRYLGDISYSLYLWHFPAIILLAAINPDQTIIDQTVTLGVVLAVSALSYYFLEDPIRKSDWLEPKSGRKRRDNGVPARLTHGALIALVLVAAVVVGAAVARTTEATPVAAAVPVPTLAKTGDKPVTEMAKLQFKVEQAAVAVAWPELKPAIDELGPDQKAPEWVKDGCLTQASPQGLDERRADPGRCSYGEANASKTAVVLGDSTSISYVPGIRAALEPKGYRVLIMTMEQCPAIAVAVVKSDKSPHPECAAFQDWAYEQVRNVKPDTVFLTSAPWAALASGATGPKLKAEWSEGLDKTFKAIESGAKGAVVLDAPPGGKSLSACATRTSKPKDCESNASALYNELVATSRSASVAYSGRMKVRHIEARLWFCSGTGACPSFIGTTPVYADQGHLTATLSAALAPVITEALGA